MLGLLIIVTFPLVVCGAKTFFFRDYGAFGYPLAFYHREAFWQGRIPLWNPLSCCGLPFLAQWNTLTLYPGSLIYLIFPLSWSLGVFNLAHMFFAGMGMFFLARRWNGNDIAAAVAGLTYAFNGLTWHCLMWPNNIAALGWMPWVVLAAERAWREGGRWIAIAALTGGVQMLAGAPEVILLTWVAGGVLCLADAVKNWREAGGRVQGVPPPHNAHPPPPEDLGELGRAGGTPYGNSPINAEKIAVSPARMVLRLAGVASLVAGLAAAQLLPFMQLLSNSQRDASFSDAQWAMPASGLADYLVPLFRCFSASHGVYSQHDQYWTSSYYIGIGTMALALFAVWRVRDSRTRILVGLAVFSLVMANGPVYAAIRHVAPPLGLMRFPIKFVVLATFIFPLIAAAAIVQLQKTSTGCAVEERWKLWWIGGLLASVIGVILVWAWLRPVVGDNLRSTLLNGLSRVLFLGLILGCVTAVRGSANRPRTRFLMLGMLLLLWLDILTHAPNLSPTVDRSVFEPNLVRQYDKWGTQLQPGVSRVMFSAAAVSGLMFHSVANPERDFIGRRLSLFDDCNLLDNAAKCDGFYSLFLPYLQQLLVRAAMATNDLPGLKDFLGVSHYENPTNVTELLTRDTYLPMITTGQAPVFADDTNTLRIMTTPGFDPRRTVFLPADVRSEASTATAGRSRILNSEFRAERVSAVIEASATSVVVIAQAAYAPWHAYVDGKPVRLWRANYGFQALEVPAGRHEVAVVYEDNAFKIGAAISLTSLGLCLLVWWFGRRTAAVEPNKGAKSELPFPHSGRNERGENSPIDSRIEPLNRQKLFRSVNIHRGPVSSLAPSEGERVGVRGPFSRPVHGEGSGENSPNYSRIGPKNQGGDFRGASGYGLPSPGGKARANTRLLKTFDPLDKANTPPAEAGTPNPGAQSSVYLENRNSNYPTVCGEVKSLKIRCTRWFGILFCSSSPRPAPPSIPQEERGIGLSNLLADHLNSRAVGRTNPAA